MSNDRQDRVEDDEIDLAELFAVIWGGRRRIALVTTVAVLLGLAYALLSQPVYQADALLQVEAKRSGMSLPTGMQDLLGGGDTQTPTEIDIMQSRMVLGQVVDRLDLDVIAEPRRLPLIGNALTRYHLPDPKLGFLSSYAWSLEAIELGELELPETWFGEKMILTATGADGYSITLPDGTTREGLLRRRLADPTLGFALRVDLLEGRPGREFVVWRDQPQNAITQLRKQFSAAETGRQSGVLRLTLTGKDRKDIARTLDAISRAYLEQNISRSSAEAQRSLEFIDEQLPTSERAVAEAQDALNAYRQQQQSVDLTYETQVLLEQATNIERQLNELALQEEEIKRRFTVNHPTYQLLLQNRAALNERLAGLREESSALPETQKEIFNLTRNLEVAQEVYLQLLSRQQELQVMRASVIGNVRILDSAVAAFQPITPRKSLIVALSLVLGGMLGVGLVLLRKFLRHGVQGGEEIEKIGLAVFATVGFSTAVVQSQSTRSNLPILAISDPTDLAIEALRSLRTALHFGMLDAKTNSVMLTSAAPGAGKSFIAVNLAIVAAQAGQRVCLIDADMRRGYLRRYFGLERHHPGLAELLSGSKALEDVLHPGPVETLDFITTGRLPPNPSELLMRPAFQEMLEKLNEKYDLILLDAPPTLAVTDPVIMGRSIGATIMVVRHLETAIGEIEAVQRIFETAGARIAGAVLNGYHATEGRYGGKYHYYNKRYSYETDKKQDG